MAHSGTEASGSRANGAVPPGERRSPASRAIWFGPYHLRADIRRLERDGVAVQLGDRAFDILCVLTEHAGEVVPNRELMARVWREVVVGAGSLRFHINALRKVLAQDRTQTPYIKNVTRRGYTFVAPVHEVLDFPAGAGTRRPDPGSTPERPTDMIGRATELAHSLHGPFDLVCFVACFRDKRVLLIVDGPEGTFAR